MRSSGGVRTGGSTGPAFGVVAEPVEEDYGGGVGGGGGGLDGDGGGLGHGWWVGLMVELEGLREVV